MKKLLILMAMAAAFVSTSCIGPRGDDGRDGKDLYLFSDTFTVQANEWKPVYDGDLFLFYEYLVNAPEINRTVFNYGDCEVYTVVNTGRETIQQPLPAIIPNEDRNGFFFKQISFDWAIGSMVIYVHDSDFAGREPGTMTFRFVLTY